MVLDKNDLRSIEKIVLGSEERLNNRISSVEVRLDKKIDGVEQKLTKKIDGVEEKLTLKIDGAEEKIISTLSREISDLADINRAVIVKTEELDYRLRIVERKLGLVVK